MGYYGTTQAFLGQKSIRHYLVNGTKNKKGTRIETWQMLHYHIHGLRSPEPIYPKHRPTDVSTGQAYRRTV